MCFASAQVVLESIQTLSQDIEYFIKPYNVSSCKQLRNLNMSIFPIIVMLITISKSYY
jgi:hypothetical protein